MKTATAVLVLSVTAPPVISSDLAITTTALSPFTYTITATNRPTSFSVIGLGALPTESVDTTNLASTGTFTFTPSVSAVGGSFNLIVTATNDAGTTTELLVVTVLPAVTVAPNFATVTLISPVPSDSFTADTTSLTVAATVTPAAGETIDAVSVRWNNPPAKPDGTPRAPIILAQLTNTGGDVYEAVVDIGFDPENREIGGGLIDLEVVAYQTNAIGNDDFASDDVQFRVEPLLAVLFPDDQLVRGLFDIGDIFASARVNTNDFSKVTARISGPGIVFSQEFDTNNPNGVFNFEVPQLINFEGTYSVEVVAEDLAGRTTTIVRELFLTETIESPVAQVVAPSPGFTNEVFTAAIATYTEQSRATVTVDGVGVVGTNVTYGLELISGGQGYYPRNARGATILTTATTAVGQLTRGLGGVTLANGRISALPDTATIFYNVGDPEWGSFGNAVMDDLGDPGANGKIDITAQFFRALGKLKSYKLFVNGADLTPGNGNLDPTPAVPGGPAIFVDIPAIQFPPAGQGSPDPGDYVVVAQVFDENGQVGTSSPVSFQIVPYDPLDIFISRQIPTGGSEEDPVIIGGSATFLAEVSPIDSIDFVEFFESNSGDKLGEGSRVQIDGQSLFRFSYVFPQAGDFKVFARASGFDGQEVISAPVDISVITGDFPNVEITAPSSGSSVPAGANLEILVAATDPDGQITTIEVFNGNEPLGSATPTGIAGQYRLNLTPSVADAGVFNLIARATDDRGNSTDSDVVTLGVVLGAVPQIEILSPAAGDEFFVDQPFEIRARITDADGTIASATLTDIEFFTTVEGVNNTITIISESLSFLNDVMSESSTPDEFVFIATINSPDVVGLVITARDDSGNETQSAPLQFTVTNGIVPDVAITAPLAGDSFTRGDIVTIDITSSDVDGSVAQVEVFNGTASLGLANVVSTGNYRLNYAANAVGTVNLSARSTDNLGNVGISNIETISIVSGDLPTVTIDSPSSGTSVTSGKNVEILVTASDPDGQITAVEIYDGALRIGFATPTGNLNEYRFIAPTFNPETNERLIGNFNLQARAVDDRGNVGFSEIVTLSVVLGAVPQIEILSPLPGDSFFINQPFVIRARITDADGSITSATFVDREIRTEAQIDNNGIIRLVIVEDSRSFTGDDILGPTSTNNVYQFSATLATADLVGLEITATDDDGNVTTSSRVQFTVTNGIAPDVAITAPLTGASYTRGDIVAIDIDASDQDGTISQVEVLNGATLLGLANFVSAGTYRFNYAADAVGNVNLIAQATDDLGNVGISNIETITIVSGAVPTVAITLPGGASYTAGDVITIDVAADDVDGFVTSVEIFNGDVSLGTASKVNAAGYRFNLPTSLADLGELQLNARATDDSSNVSISELATVTVTTGAVPTGAIILPDEPFYAGDIITIDVEVGDLDGFVTSVVIFDGATEIGIASKVNDTKYRLVYGPLVPGTLRLSAVVTDDRGNVATSNVVALAVASNVLPTVTIDSPADGASYTQGDSISLEITANDADGFVTSVEIFNGDVSLGTATGVGGDQYRYTIDTATAEIASGTLNLSARATDNIGNSGSGIVSVDLSPVVFSVSFTDPTENPLELIAAAGEFFDTSYTFTVEVGGIAAGSLQSLVWQLDSEDPVEQADLGTGLSFSQSFTIDTCATLFVTATNVDGVAVTTSLAIGTSFPDPVSDSSDFVDYIYYQIRGTAPSQAEKDAALGYLVNNGDNAATRAELTAGLYPDSQLLGSRQTLVALVYKTVTGQWPTAAEMESALLLLETDPEALVSQTVEAQSGDINSGGSETFTFNYTAGTEVSIRVSPDGSNGNPLSDPTLTVNDPNGTFVGFSDDNFGSGTFSLDAVLTFTATQPGDYTATVRGFSSFQSGDFAIVSTSVSTESNNDVLLARVLVESLQDSYNGANGFLADSDVPNSGLAPQFVSQIYRNKHGVGITNFNSSTLGARLTGTDEDMGNGYILPGYSGDVLTFVAAFALDTELAVGPLASLKTADGYRYTSQLFYGRPNNPLSGWNAVATDLQDEFNIAKAVSDLLPNLENPDLTEYDGMTLEVALATIFIDPDFITQFPGSCVATPPVSPVEAAVASALVVAGEQQLTGLTDDADGDGDINLIEYALGGDPVDASNGAVVLQSIEAPALAAGPQTFVLTYVQLEERPAGMSIIVECSTDLIQWQAADPFSPVPAADQSGVPVGYERVEYRVILDPVAQSCMFRVAVQVE